MSELCNVATGLALVWSINCAYNCGRDVLTDCEPDFPPILTHPYLPRQTESNKHVGVRPTISLMFCPLLVPPPFFIYVQLIKKGKQLRPCKTHNSRQEGKDRRIKKLESCDHSEKKNNQWPCFSSYIFFKELLMTASRAEKMPVQRSVSPYFYTHHNDCTTQQKKKKGRNGPSYFKDFIK